MNESKNSPVCERASDLIAFLYHEADEHEARDFQLHLGHCSICREEAASFGVVRESITAWRDEALAGFVSTPVTKKQKSAIAALRQFFELSPLWLKGATALVTVAFCILAVLAFVNPFVNDNNDRVSSNPPNPNPKAIYTEDEVNRIVQAELAKQAKPVEAPPTIKVVKSPEIKPKQSQATSTTQLAKSRRPLSKTEREQLAADLRLLSTRDDETLHLLGDRINQ
jgi:hypothetical protein